MFLMRVWDKLMYFQKMFVHCSHFGKCFYKLLQENDEREIVIKKKNSFLKFSLCFKKLKKLSCYELYNKKVSHKILYICKNL